MQYLMLVYANESQESKLSEAELEKMDNGCRSNIRYRIDTYFTALQTRHICGDIEHTGNIPGEPLLRLRSFLILLCRE